METVRTNLHEKYGITAPPAGEEVALRIEKDRNSRLKAKCILTVLDLSPRKLGSFEEYLAVLSERIVNAGGRSVVAVSTEPSPDVAELFFSSGVQVEVLPFAEGTPAVTVQLKQILKIHAPDVVHFHFVPLSSPLFEIAGSTGATVFVSYHASVDPVPPRSVIRRLAAYVRNTSRWRKVQCFITPSEYIRRHIIDDFLISSGRIVSIHNGVNLERHHPGKVESIDIREKYSIAADEKIVIHIAYAHPYKGIDDFIRAATVVKERNIRFRFLVVGDGERMAGYKELAGELGLAGNVTFTGLADGAMIDSLLAQCDISTLACTWGEAFSLVVLESMARGKAIVATAVGGTPEAILPDESGILVPPCDWRKLGVSISELLQNDQLRKIMGQKARKRAEELFDINRWVRRTLSLYVYDDPNMGER